MRRIPTPPAVQPTSTGVTLHGTLLGTPSYMSPEQAKGRTDIDNRADVWALGVIAYHLLTDAYPFEGDTFEDLLERIVRLRGTPILTRLPDLPQVVGDFFARAFAPSLASRFQSAAAFAAAFEQLEPLAAGAGSGRDREASSPSLQPSVLGEDLPLVVGVSKLGGLARVAGGVLVAAVLAATGALVSIHLEREPSRAAAAAAAAPLERATTTSSDRDEIPPPPAADEIAPAVVVEEPAAAHTEPSAMPARTPSAAPKASTSSFGRAASPTAARPRRAFDRSEVF
jgi:serine/threonine-protein kinase